MKQQADRGRKEAEEWKKGDRVMLSTKNLVFKERLVKKLVDQYVGPYFIPNKSLSSTVVLSSPTSNNSLSSMKLAHDKTRMKRDGRWKIIEIEYSVSILYYLYKEIGC